MKTPSQREAEVERKMMDCRVETGRIGKAMGVRPGRVTLFKPSFAVGFGTGVCDMLGFAQPFRLRRRDEDELIRESWIEVGDALRGAMKIFADTHDLDAPASTSLRFDRALLDELLGETHAERPQAVTAAVGRMREEPNRARPAFKPTR